MGSYQTEDDKHMYIQTQILPRNLLNGYWINFRGFQALIHQHGDHIGARIYFEMS
jgi:hypothetical protein